MTVLEQLDLFHGDTTENLSQVYARLTDVEEMASLTLSGHIRGPFCRLAQTLPVTAPLEDLGPGQSVLASATLPDPCFWSPDLPALYEVHVELLRCGQVVETAHRSFGIRSLGAQGKSLFRNSRRWVPRGVSRPSATAADLSLCRETASALVIRDPSDDLCAAASRDGVFIIASIDPSHNELGELRRLSRWPAVGIVVLTSEGSGVDFRGVAPNVVLGQSIVSRESPTLEAWAHLAIGRVETPTSFAAKFANCPLPVVAGRTITQNLTIPEARSECDRLQRDLAPVGDFAGYFV